MVKAHLRLVWILMLCFAATGCSSFPNQGGIQANSEYLTKKFLDSIPKPVPWEVALDNGQTHTVTGDGMIIDGFPVPQLDTTRRVWIYLPPSYKKSKERYPVLYMHDGQNVFDAATSYIGEWRVDEIMADVSKENNKHEVIVVAIDNGETERSNEYNPWVTEYGYGGKGDQYATFIVETLKPYIDHTFRTKPGREDTAIAGSSFGGYISLYTGMKYQDVFSKIGSLSGAFFQDGGKLYEFIKTTGKKQDMTIYMDVGGMESDLYLVSGNRQIYDLLLEMGFDNNKIKYVFDPTGKHDELSWSIRFPGAFKWWMEN